MDPEERYRRAAEALEQVQAAEKKALREFHDARHALIAARIQATKEAAKRSPGPCPHCGAMTRIVDDDDEPRHVDPLAGVKCRTARLAEMRAAGR